MTRVLIVGGGFAGLNAARRLGGRKDVEVTLVDRRNHHLFQPLLYQVATAGLSPAEIAAPIRTLVSGQRNVQVLQAAVQDVDLDRRVAVTDAGELPWDYLVLASGAQHAYFGHEEWEEHAPGLKTLEQATEIRRRVLQAYELAERTDDAAERKRLLTFVVVGAGPTGVELAGALGEMSRYALARDFRRIDPKLARVLLIEAGPRILPTFDDALASRATRDLESLGVQVWTDSMVTGVDADGVALGPERLRAATVIWAAGVQASPLGARLGVEPDRQGRVRVEPDLSVPGHPHVLVAGDLARFEHGRDAPLPGQAPVAMQQGRHVAAVILADLAGRERPPFRYKDKGQMATIGRSRAIVELPRATFAGLFAWLVWLVVHIYYLSTFRNRVLVLLKWAWSYLSYHRGARLIVEKEWRLFPRARPAPAAGGEGTDGGAGGDTRAAG